MLVSRQTGLPRTHRPVPAILAAAVAMVTLGLCACGSSAVSGATNVGTNLGTGTESSPVTLRLGYLSNLTHAPAVAGIQKGLLAQSLGSSVTLQTQVFKAGPDEVTAILAGALDAAYMGPNPAINGFAKSHGSALRIIAGSTSGGAGLVVRSDENISSAADLKGKSIATPQLGNTQDVALRAWLNSNGLHTNPQGGGDVKIVPTDNATALQGFEQKQIDGAWVPEPWTSRLVDEGHGKLLVDESTLWPGGKFATTELVVSTAFLTAHAPTVRSLLAGNIAAVNFVTSNTADAKQVVNDALASVTGGKKLATQVLDDAWSHLTFTVDPLASALTKAANDAKSVGLLDSSTDIHGLIDVRILNDLLAAAGKPAVDAAGVQAG